MSMHKFTNGVFCLEHRKRRAREKHGGATQRGPDRQKYRHRGGQTGRERHTEMEEGLTSHPVFAVA